jgi:CheY-like chemotaxis protein
MAVVERNARAQAVIVNDILDVSSIVTGKLQIVSNPVELAPIIQSVVDTMHPAVAAQAINLTVSLDSQDGLVFGSPDRLQQVIWNLVSNAIKFTPQGGQIQIRLEQVDSHVELKVIDSGIGINKQFLPYIFERFRQADASMTREHGGLGLGLAIVKSLVELHGGTVAAESGGEGKGATFIVRLPLAVVPGAAAVPASDLEFVSTQSGETKAVSADAPDLTGLRVLVVDDDPDTLEIQSAVLNWHGAEVRSAASANAALTAFLEWKPNVLISDLGMPDEDGFSLIRKVRALMPEQGSGVPAAALTAYASEDDRLQALAAGYQIHLPKPVEPTKLAATVAGLAKQAKKT